MGKYKDYLIKKSEKIDDSDYDYLSKQQEMEDYNQRVEDNFIREFTD